MLFDASKPEETLWVSREDPNNPLASFSKHGFELDGAFWPSAEHYYQAMKFDDTHYRERIRNAAHPALAKRLGGAFFKRKRRGWKAKRQTLMTRATYTKCRTHLGVAKILLDTGELPIQETSQYDYFWGLGRDLRGQNIYGKVLQNVREKLRQEHADKQATNSA